MLNSLNYKFSFLFFTFFIFSNYSCKKDCKDPKNPECENYDPCYGINNTSAYFIVEETLGEHWIEGDTIIGIGNITSVRFRALQDADSFIWTIGSETIHQKSFIRADFPLDTYIPVTLVVFNKNSNKFCHPDDNGIDTFKRIIYTWPSQFTYDQINKKYVVINRLPIQGEYLGYFESNPNKEVRITLEDTVSACNKIGVTSRILLNAFNLPDGYYQPIYDDKNCGYFYGGWTKSVKAAKFFIPIYKTDSYQNFNPDSVYKLIGFAKLDDNLKNIEVDIEYFPLDDQIEKKYLKRDKFKGVKIN